MKKNLFGIFLFLVIILSTLLFGLGLFYKSDIDNRTKAGTPNFVGLPVANCPTAILRMQPDSKTPLSQTLTVDVGQNFKVVVANSGNSTTVTNASIQVQKPDGTVIPVGSSGAWENSPQSISGEYLFIATIGTTCKTNYATLTVSGNNNGSSSSGIVTNIPSPVIVNPAIPETTGATKNVCATGCNYTTIQDAVKNTPEKGKIFIKNGTYKNNFFFTDVNPQGSKEVTIEGESLDGVVIDGSDNVASVCNTLTLGKLGGKYLVKNLTIKSSGGCAGISVGGDNNDVINDVNFTADNIKVIGSKGAGIYFKGGSVGKITNSTFTTSVYAGVSIHGKAKVKVTGSTFKDQQNQAIDIKEDSEAYFESNTIDNNGTTSVEQVLLTDNAYAGFKSNTFKNTKYTAFRLKNISKIRSEDNVFDGVTQPRKYIVDATAQITLTNSVSNSGGTSNDTVVPGALHPSCVVYDFNKDNKVDIMDFAEWRTCYQKKGATNITASGCGFADIVKDNWVDITDFSYFVVAYTNYRTDPNKICTK